jgi:hypothetical protein
MPDDGRSDRNIEHILKKLFKMFVVFDCLYFLSQVVAKDSVLLGCYAVLMVKWCPTFPRIMEYSSILMSLSPRS